MNDLSSRVNCSIGIHFIDGGWRTIQERGRLIQQLVTAFNLNKQKQKEKIKENGISKKAKHLI